MTPDEARSVLAVMLSTGSAYPSCASDLVDRFAEAFPDHRALAERMWFDHWKFPRDLSGSERAHEASQDRKRWNRIRPARIQQAAS